MGAPRGLSGAWRQTLRSAGLLLITAGGLAVIPVHARLRRPAHRAALRARYRHFQVGLVLRLFGVDLRVAPPAPPPAQGGRLVVANHRSALDIAVLLWLFDGRLVSRGDLAAWPLLGVAASKAGMRFVNREHAGSRLAVLGAVRSDLERGDTVIVFPEGTTFSGDEVHPFSAGCFAAAIACGAEVVPVGLACEPAVEYLDESFTQHLARVAARPAARLAARIGTPRIAARDSAPDALAAEMRAVVQGLVRMARGDLEAGPPA